MLRLIALLLGAVCLAAEPTQDRYYWDKLSGRRSMQIQRLHAYALRGEFPRNLDFPGKAVPYFIDAGGTPCAVADMMIKDGAEAPARKIGAADNHILVSAVKDGPLADWILSSGLLQEEAALIQPSYHHHKAPGEDEKSRVRSRLLSVELKLRGQTPQSLKTAVSRLLSRLCADEDFAAKLPFPAVPGCQR
jgi:hypothetical protein